jgi:hypothetical protein
MPFHRRSSNVTTRSEWTVRRNYYTGVRVRLKWLPADQRTSLRQTQSSELKLAPSLTIKLAPSLRSSKYRQRTKNSRAERIKALRASGH